MLIPYSTEVLIRKWPISNLAIMGCCIISFILLLAGVLSSTVLEAMILSGWNPLGLIGHQFLHAGFWHLGFNMLYLWVFGNAVCEKIGNLAYAGTFLLAGVFAGVVHNIMSNSPAVGASGAINGIVGLYLVLYPINRINCFYWFFRPGTFDISGFWLIGCWFVVDAWHAISGTEAGIAYWAHVGGFLCGLGLGVVFLKTGVARMARYDNPTLLDYFGKNKQGAQPKDQKPERYNYTSTLAGEMVDRQKTEPRQRPPLSQDINFDCPHCSQNLDVSEEMMGRTIICPRCRGEIQLQEE